MRFYRLTYHDPEVGLCCAYATTKRKAHMAKRELEAMEDFEGSVDIAVINVPTTKDRLVKWLNMNAVTQDGYGDVQCFPRSLI